MLWTELERELNESGLWWKRDGFNKIEVAGPTGNFTMKIEVSA